MEIETQNLKKVPARADNHDKQIKNMNLRLRY